MQTGGYTSPLRHGERIELSPEDADRLQMVPGEVVRIVSRRGAIEAPTYESDENTVTLAVVNAVKVRFDFWPLGQTFGDA